MRKVESLIKVLNPEEVKTRFLPKLKERLEELMPVVNLLEQRKEIGKKLYLDLTSRMEGLENFLDDYGAAENTDYVYLREIVASMRWFGKAAFSIEHIISRYPSYQADECSGLSKFLTSKLGDYEKVLEKLGDELGGEVKEIGLQIPQGIAKFEPDTLQQEKLPANLNGDSIEGEREKLVSIVGEYFSLANGVKKVLASQDLTEEKIGGLAEWLHRLQTKYDSFVKNSDLEKENLEIKKLRGHISLPLHFLEISGDLIHYCERHANKVRNSETGERINRIVKKEKMEKDAYAFFELAEFFICREKEQVKYILEQERLNPDDYELHKTVISLFKKDLELFHLRPFIPISKIAKKYEKESRLYVNRREYDLKDTLDLSTGVPYVRICLAEQEQDSLDLIIVAPRKALREYEPYMKEKFNAVIKPQEQYVCPITINSDKED